ncbi:ATP-binding cassette domain-containing protein [Streptomyces sp. NPDC085460]|uniref:ATP-binding cassette domain-containing protein n=1 Tax=Streptomyces sp. NPDC085460 TaxID=3365723 RepID=UPI0037D5420E
MTTTGRERERGPVRLAGVGRRYGPRGPWVLRGVDLDLPAGRLVRAAGANGTGKSTLLRLVAGVDAPAEGRITGRPARTAYVPERFPPDLPFTALGYLVHLGRLQGLGGGTARARAGEWLERLGAGQYRDTALADLSKGTAQKVAVAQALLAAPDLLVLDEAWTGLDTGARAELDRAVRERVAAGATVLFVDHTPDRLAADTDTTLHVTAGRLHPDHHAPPRPAAPARARASATTAAPAPGTGPTGEAAPAGAASPPAPVVLAPSGGADVVRIVASGARPLPEGLPGGAVGVALADGGAEVFRVGGADSDDLLRALLGAGWHVRRVETEGERS